MADETKHRKLIQRDDAYREWSDLLLIRTEEDSDDGARHIDGERVLRTCSTDN